MQECHGSLRMGCRLEDRPLVIIEQNTPAKFFENPEQDRTKTFLTQIAH